MKTISDKKIKVQGAETTYGKLCLSCVQAPPPNGAKMDVQYKRMRVIGALELAKKNKTNIKLEDADFDVLYNCVKEMPWGIVDEEIAKFGKYMEEVKLQESSEKKKKAKK